MVSRAWPSARPRVARAPWRAPTSKKNPTRTRRDRFTVSTFHLRKFEASSASADTVRRSTDASITPSAHAMSADKLPRSWHEFEDEHGKTYYWHEKTGESTYERPYDKCGTFGCILTDRHAGVRRSDSKH